MSKSLKNFITIKKILEDFNARQIRMVFLLHQWNSLMNYSTEKTFPEAVAKERGFTNFFRQVQAVIRVATVQHNSQKWNE